MSNGSFIQVVPVHTVGATAECFGNEVPHPMAGYQGIREGFTSGDVGLRKELKSLRVSEPCDRLRFLFFSGLARGSLPLAGFGWRGVIFLPKLRYGYYARIQFTF